MTKKSNKNHIAVVLFLAAVTFVSGCKKKESPPPQPPPKAAAPKPQAVQAQMSTPKVVAAAGDQFNFSSKKDPFKPFVIAAPAKSVGTARRKVAGMLPIQNFEVEQFKITGIVVGLKESRAMIVDPAGKAYVVKQGMLIGRNDGRITKITPGWIEVHEQFRDDSGKLLRRTVKLTLPRK